MRAGLARMHRRGRVLGIVAMTVAAVAATAPLSGAATAASPALPGWHVPAVAYRAPEGYWAVAYADGRWVAVGRDGAIITSTTLTTWQNVSTGDGSWQSVAYGDGRWVVLSAFGGADNELWSTNGTVWHDVTVAQHEWSSLVYADGRFVTVSFDGYAMSSANGTTWSTPVAEPLGSWFAITYGDGLFVAVDGDNGGYVMTSPNGVTWRQFLPAELADADWGAVAYGNGTFVATDASPSGYMLSSTNGSTWVEHRYSHAGDYWGATFGCGEFVASDLTVSTGNYFQVSTLGETWTAQANHVDAGNEWTSVGYGDDAFVSVDSSGYVLVAHLGPHCAQTLPDPPRGVHGTLAGEVLHVGWAAPLAGTPRPTSYSATATAGTSTARCTTAVTSCTLHVRAGTAYHVTVVSTDSSGSSGPSGAIEVGAASPVVTTSALVVASGGSLVAGVADAQPGATVTIAEGSARSTCIATADGSCYVLLEANGAGETAVTASYVVHSVTHHATATHVAIVAVAVGPGLYAVDVPVPVSVTGGIPGSTFALTTNQGTAFDVTLDGAGDAVAYLVVQDEGEVSVTSSDAGVPVGEFYLSVGS